MTIQSYSLQRRYRERALGVLLIAALVSASSIAMAADVARVNMERPLSDTLLPSNLRKIEASPPTYGADLQAQVERKLQAGFAAADKGRTGTLTREQAQAAGLGFVVNHFDAIDKRKTGAVRFDDVKHFLRERGAQLD